MQQERGKSQDGQDRAKQHITALNNKLKQMQETIQLKVSIGTSLSDWAIFKLQSVHIIMDQNIWKPIHITLSQKPKIDTILFYPKVFIFYICQKAVNELLL